MSNKLILAVASGAGNFLFLRAGTIAAQIILSNTGGEKSLGEYYLLINLVNIAIGAATVPFVNYIQAATAIRASVLMLFRQSAMLTCASLPVVCIAAFYVTGNIWSALIISIYLALSVAEGLFSSLFIKKDGTHLYALTTSIRGGVTIGLTAFLAPIWGVPGFLACAAAAIVIQLMLMAHFYRSIQGRDSINQDVEKEPNFMADIFPSVISCLLVPVSFWLISVGIERSSGRAAVGVFGVALNVALLSSAVCQQAMLPLIKYLHKTGVVSRQGLATRASQLNILAPIILWSILVVVIRLGGEVIGNLFHLSGQNQVLMLRLLDLLMIFSAIQLLKEAVGRQLIALRRFWYSAFSNGIWCCGIVCGIFLVGADSVNDVPYLMIILSAISLVVSFAYCSYISKIEIKAYVAAASLCGLTWILR
ncbi:hypothetical protein [Cupriavidus lacunae]|nr:hypothetical protein [Cupriavidus lacunae]